MKIYPDQGNFQINLSTQELRNILEGLMAAPHPDSPWSKSIVQQIKQALADHLEYNSKCWG